MKPSPGSQIQHPAALSQAVSSPAKKTSPSASDAHPHLLFLKTGGGSTVAQPKHQLTPQQLQMLADGTGTLEGLTVGPYSPLAGSTKPVNTQLSQEGTGYQGSSLPLHEGPLGIATVMLEGDKDSKQLASLFTPRHDQAVATAGQTLSHTAEDEPAVDTYVQGLFQQQSVPAGKAVLRPSAKTLQGVHLGQAAAHKAGATGLEAAAASRRDVFAEPDSLLWLEEVTADHPGKVAEHKQDLQQQEEAEIEGPLQLQWENLNGQLLMDKGSLLVARGQPADVQKPTLSQPVLLTLLLSIATDNPEVIACNAERHSMTSCTDTPGMPPIRPALDCMPAFQQLTLLNSYLAHQHMCLLDSTLHTMPAH